MKHLSLLFGILLLSKIIYSQEKTIQERLGYSKDTKLLIIHADDLGVSHSEDAATINAMEKGSVSSASIMVPTPWFTEIAAYAAANKKADFGLHLTLTSEWNNYKWGPLSDEKDVTGLVNKNGFLYASADSIFRTAKPMEIEMELRRQIEKAKQFGIDVTHLDSHMGVLFGNADYLKVLIKLGHEYKLPVMLFKTGPRSAFGIKLDSLLGDKDVLVDGIFTANPDDFKKGMDQFYTGVIKSLKPGFNVMIIHTAYDDTEMRSVTVDHPDWGAAWRQADFNFFTSENCKKLLKDENIKVITWREVRDKLVR